MQGLLVLQYYCPTDDDELEPGMKCPQVSGKMSYNFSKEFYWAIFGN